MFFPFTRKSRTPSRSHDRKSETRKSEPKRRSFSRLKSDSYDLRRKKEEFTVTRKAARNDRSPIPFSQNVRHALTRRVRARFFLYRLQAGALRQDGKESERREGEGRYARTLADHVQLLFFSLVGCSTGSRGRGPKQKCTTAGKRCGAVACAVYERALCSRHRRR